MRILVVDDNAPLLKSIKRLLTACGHNVQTASNGSEGMRMLEDDLDIDAILTDVNCPSRSGSGDDGIWLAEKFGQLFPERSKRVPLFFMTGEMMDGQEKKIKTINHNPIFLKGVAGLVEYITLLEKSVEESKQLEQSSSVVT